MKIITNCVLLSLMVIVRSGASLRGPTDDPKSVLVLIALGQISAEMKDFASARKYFEEALKFDPNGKYGREAKEALRKLKKK